MLKSTILSRLTAGASLDKSASVMTYTYFRANPHSAGILIPEKSRTEFIQFCDNQSCLIYIYEKLYAVISIFFATFLLYGFINSVQDIDQVNLTFHCNLSPVQQPVHRKAVFLPLLTFCCLPTSFCAAPLHVHF